MYDLGSHLIDQALVLFGWPDFVFADIMIMRPVSKVDDYFELLLYYKNFRVRLKASYQVREAIPAFVIHGSKGSYVKHRSDVQEKNLLQGKLPVGENWGKELSDAEGILNTELDGEVVRQKISSPFGNYSLFYEQLHKAICLNAPLPVTAEEGLKVIKIIEAAIKSNEEKRVIKMI